MARASNRETRKINSELFSLTYGALVYQLVKDYEGRMTEVNTQLERIGAGMGVRLVDDFLAKTGSGRCKDLREVVDVLTKSAFKMYLGFSPQVANWSPAQDECSLLLDATNPITEWTELSDEHAELVYCSLLCGLLKGALEAVHHDVQVSIVQDSLKGAANTEIRIKFLGIVAETLPAGED